MTQEHPITPPPELVKQMWRGCPTESDYLLNQFATSMARWGADQQLEACVEWMNCNCPNVGSHHLTRDLRPKPQSLKEQALETLASADGPDYPVIATVLTADQHALIRRALESLPD